MINLGDKNWGVKDSGLLAYKQVGSKYFNKDFDFTRASNGTYVDKNGVLQTAELYNLLDYSNNFGLWNVQNVTGGQIGYDGTNNAWIQEGASRLQRNISLSSGVYTGSVYVKADFSNYVLFYIVGTTPARVVFELIGDGSIVYNVSVASSIEKVSSDGWYRLSITLNSDISTFRIYPLDDASETQTTNSSIYVQDAQLVEGTEPLDYQYTNGRVGIPRIDFSDGVGALLLEPQRTNLLLNSNSFDNWGGSKVSVTSGQEGIYGTNDAFKLIQTIDSGFHYISQIVNLTGDYIYSICAKKAEYEGISFYIPSPTSGAASSTTFNLSTGTFTLNTHEATSEYLGDGWYRIALKTKLSGSTGINTYVNQSIQQSESGDGTSGIYIQHAQLELGAYPTSIIETTTSAVTRIADVANNCGSEQDFNSEEGVLYAEITALANDGTSRVISLNDGSNSNRIHLFYFVGSNTIYVNYRVSGTSYAIMDAPLDNLLDFNKIAYKFSSGDFALWVNGVKVDTDGNTTMMPSGTIDRLDFDAGGGGAPFYGKVRNVKYFPEALGDTKLMTLTGGDGSLQGLFNTFQARVLADGGYIESQDCIINEIKELL